MDEAGRGPLAGPVCAAAVVLPADTIEAAFAGELAGLTDSKQLSPARREHYHTVLRALPGIAIGLASASVEEIDRLNILRATHLAMARALAALNPPPDCVLVDGLPVPALGAQAHALVGGDGLSLSIAAASVIAKVARDRLMLRLDRDYPGYGFAAHKGYGAQRHLRALLTLGPCPAHRRSFRPVADAARLRERADKEDVDRKASGAA